MADHSELEAHSDVPAVASGAASDTFANNKMSTPDENECAREKDLEQEKELLSNFWPSITDPDPLVLFGFRRFRTSHLLNLRFLEQQISEIDKHIFQAGLELGDMHGGKDRLALSQACLRNQSIGAKHAAVSKDMLMRLSDLLQRYGRLCHRRLCMSWKKDPADSSDLLDSALTAFNQVMTMETFCLADHQKLYERSSLSWEEAFRTRLLQVDRPSRTSVRDPVHHALRKLLRRMWYSLQTRNVRTAGSSHGVQTLAGRANTNLEDAVLESSNSAEPPGTRRYMSFDTAWLADAITRFLFGLTTGILLIVPTAILLREDSRSHQLVVVCVFVVAFCFFVALASRASPQETMAASAAYAAVLVVFISTNILCST